MYQTIYVWKSKVTNTWGIITYYRYIDYHNYNSLVNTNYI